jgi:hypothetical protein
MAHAAVPWLGILLVGVIVLFLPRFFSRAKSSIDVFRALRADRQSRYIDMALVAAFHARSPTRSSSEPLDDRTWTDLDLDSVFAAIDHTASEPGRQYLYHLLRSPRFEAEPLARLDGVARTFAAHGEMADELRAALTQLSDSRAAYLDELFYGDIPDRPWFWWLFPLLTVSAVACLALVFVWPPLVLAFLGICVLNVIAQIVYKPRVKRLIPALHEVPAFLRVAGVIGALGVPEFAEESRTLRDGASGLRALRLATSWLTFEPGQASEFAGTFYEYFNLLFLLDVNAFVFATTALRGSRDTARGMFEALGYLDSAQSLAAWRSTLSNWCAPTFTPARKALEVEKLEHPLLTDAVPNSVALDGQSLLITGSNMSGKTTFVRTLGVNAVLAQTMYTVCATSWRAPMLGVRTSIGRAESLLEGKSYYLAEVESVLALVRAKGDARQHLFLLDEVFRGTNTTERVAAACAVLSYLNQGDDIVVAATHDLELLGLLSGEFAMHHFREQVVNGSLAFDYLIQPGPSSTRNAIALLTMMNYPEALVARALAIIDGQFSQPGR